MSAIELRIARLEAEAEIRRLVVSYCFDIDDREIERIAKLFTSGASVRSADGVMNARGRDAIMAMYQKRFEVLGPGAHYSHDHWIDLSDIGEGRARGRVTGHAELERNGQMMVCALRYDDIYHKSESGWQFAERLIQFLYYVPVSEYSGILLKRDRNRAYAEPMPADYPETLPSWKSAGTGKA
jgi:hypothetical protein